MRKLEAKGIKVQRVQIKGGIRYAVSTGALKGQTRELCSLLGREKCFVTKAKDSFSTSDFVVWFPTGYLYRLERDTDRKEAIGLFGVFAFIPVLLAIALPFIDQDDAWKVGVTILVVLCLVWLAAHKFLTQAMSAEVLDMKAWPSKFVIGLSVGAVWTLVMWAFSKTVPQPWVFLGAFWIFIVANIVWLATLGYDRLRLEYELEAVDGKSASPDVNRFLDSL